MSHGASLAATEDGGEATAELLAKLSVGDCPDEVLELWLTGKLMGLGKKDNGTSFSSTWTGSQQIGARSLPDPQARVATSSG